MRRFFTLTAYELLFDITEVKRSYDYIISEDIRTSQLFVLLPFAAHGFLVVNERIPPREKKNIQKYSIFSYCF